MTSPLLRRLDRLTLDRTRTRPEWVTLQAVWMPWKGRPFGVWPDAALLAFIYDSAGLPVPPVPPSDEEIARVAGLPEAAA